MNDGKGMGVIVIPIIGFIWENDQIDQQNYTTTYQFFFFSPILKDAGVITNTFSQFRTLWPF